MPAARDMSRNTHLNLATPGGTWSQRGNHLEGMKTEFHIGMAGNAIGYREGFLRNASEARMAESFFRLYGVAFRPRKIFHNERDEDGEEEC